MATDARIEVIPVAWRRTMRRAAGPAVALALVLTGAGAAAGFSRTAAPDTTAVASGTTSLWLSGSSLSYADAQEASGLLGWQAASYSLPGVGISRGTGDSGLNLPAVAQRLLPMPDPPDVVVLQGGEADHTPGAEPLQVAADRLLALVRSTTGARTQVVLVGPIPGAEVPESLRRVNQVLARAAQQAGVSYVDAVALGWQAGDPAVPARLAGALRAISR